MNQILNNHNHQWSGIPFLGQVVYLRGNSNISTGGDSLDFTEEIPESYQKLAIESAKAAGATFCGMISHLSWSLTVRQ
ncbi:hypothetical protein [Paenibacillus alvei]|uniref:hypothetical protein n=1 Tax=Paenibacillus TaxID=44249 RepID=UPI002282F5B3|nr:hypothetical protein [Paenibacillus alvei]